MLGEHGGTATEAHAELPRYLRIDRDPVEVPSKFRRSPEPAHRNLAENGIAVSHGRSRARRAGRRTAALAIDAAARLWIAASLGGAVFVERGKRAATCEYRVSRAELDALLARRRITADKVADKAVMIGAPETAIRRNGGP